MSNWKGAIILAALFAAVLPASASQRYPAGITTAIMKGGIVPARIIPRAGRRYLKPGHKTSTYRKKKASDRGRQARY
jgi:hypothetical protein